MLRVLTDLRPGHHEAYAAWRSGRPIGIVRWIRTPDFPGAAELALEVVDAEQGAGVGRALAAFAGVQAWRAGVRTMLISVDPDNVRIHGWLSALHARTLADDADRFAIPTRALYAPGPQPTHEHERPTTEGATPGPRRSYDMTSVPRLIIPASSRPSPRVTVRLRRG